MRLDNPELLDEFRGPGSCHGCGQQCRNREAAHILAKGMGGGGRLDHRWNLLALGGPWECGCHRRQHNGLISIHALWDAVAKREGVSVDEIKQELWRIRRLPKGSAV